MHLDKRLCALATAVVLTAPAAALAMPPASLAEAPPAQAHRAAEPAQVILDWERILLQTVYPAKPIPTGVPLLGFTSGAMYDAVTKSQAQPESSETAAVARAAHDVLVHYLPASSDTLDSHLATTLAAVPDAEDRARGELLGAAAANEMLASRVGDGYDDTSIHYTLPPAIGTWQPVPPATDMLGAWLGSVDRMVLKRPVPVDGPDPLTSRRYAADFNEVKSLGGTADSGTERTQGQTDTALFFNSNSATMVSDALIRHLESDGAGLSLRRTARLFAQIHAAMTDSVIQVWKLKRDVGFWRPIAAIAGADDDGNPGTVAQADWAPLLTTPPYSDYVSGHASLTGPAIEVIRQTLGERTPLELISVNSPTPRTYPTLRALERAAFHARIWGGLHFRDAMDDGYLIGHVTAHRVMAQLD